MNLMNCEVRHKEPKEDCKMARAYMTERTPAEYTQVSRSARECLYWKYGR